MARGGNNVITLSRVAAVFPMATLFILANGEVVVPRAVTLNVNDFGNDFPRQMQTVIAAAIFPKGPNGTSLIKVLLLYLIEENKLLSNVAGASDGDILKRVLPFARASYVSSIVPQENRLQACQTVKILTDQGQIATEIVLASNIFSQKHATADLSFMG